MAKGKTSMKDKESRALEDDEDNQSLGEDDEDEYDTEDDSVAETNPVAAVDPSTGDMSLPLEVDLDTDEGPEEDDDEEEPAKRQVNKSMSEVMDDDDIDTKPKAKSSTTSKPKVVKQSKVSNTKEPSALNKPTAVIKPKAVKEFKDVNQKTFYNRDPGVNIWIFQYTEESGDSAEVKYKLKKIEKKVTTSPQQALRIVFGKDIKREEVVKQCNFVCYDPAIQTFTSIGWYELSDKKEEEEDQVVVGVAVEDDEDNVDSEEDMITAMYAWNIVEFSSFVHNKQSYGTRLDVQFCFIMISTLLMKPTFSTLARIATPSFVYMVHAMATSEDDQMDLDAALASLQFPSKMFLGVLLYPMVPSLSQKIVSRLVIPDFTDKDALAKHKNELISHLFYTCTDDRNDITYRVLPILFMIPENVKSATNILTEAREVELVDTFFKYLPYGSENNLPNSVVIIGSNTFDRLFSTFSPKVAASEHDTSMNIFLPFTTNDTKRQRLLDMIRTQPNPDKSLIAKNIINLFKSVETTSFVQTNQRQISKSSKPKKATTKKAVKSETNSDSGSITNQSISSQIQQPDDSYYSWSVKIKNAEDGKDKTVTSGTGWDTLTSRQHALINAATQSDIPGCVSEAVLESMRELYGYDADIRVHVVKTLVEIVNRVRVPKKKNFYLSPLASTKEESDHEMYNSVVCHVVCIPTTSIENGWLNQTQVCVYHDDSPETKYSFDQIVAIINDVERQIAGSYKYIIRVDCRFGKKLRRMIWDRRNLKDCSYELVKFMYTVFSQFKNYQVELVKINENGSEKVKSEWFTPLTFAAPQCIDDLIREHKVPKPNNADHYLRLFDPNFNIIYVETTKAFDSDRFGAHMNSLYNEKKQIVVDLGKKKETYRHLPYIRVEYECIQFTGVKPITILEHVVEEEAQQNHIQVVQKVNALRKKYSQNKHFVIVRVKANFTPDHYITWQTTSNIVSNKNEFLAMSQIKFKRIPNLLSSLDVLEPFFLKAQPTLQTRPKAIRAKSNKPRQVSTKQKKTTENVPKRVKPVYTSVQLDCYKVDRHEFTDYIKGKSLQLPSLEVLQSYVGVSSFKREDDPTLNRKVPVFIHETKIENNNVDKDSDEIISSFYPTFDHQYHYVIRAKKVSDTTSYLLNEKVVLSSKTTGTPELKAAYEKIIKKLVAYNMNKANKKKQTRVKASVKENKFLIQGAYVQDKTLVYRNAKLIMGNYTAKQARVRFQQSNRQKDFPAWEFLIIETTDVVAKGEPEPVIIFNTTVSDERLAELRNISNLFDEYKKYLPFTSGDACLQKLNIV